MRFTFFHRTPSAVAILANGFQDSTVDRHGMLGVWISDVPVPPDGGAKGKDLLLIEIDIAAEDLTRYEISDFCRPFREWCVPQGIVNRASIRQLTADEEDAIEWPEIEQYSLPSDTWGEFRIYRRPDGPDNPPAWVSGKWYWTHFGEDDVDSDDDPPYWTPYDTREEAEAAARRFEATTAPPPL